MSRVSHSDLLSAKANAINTRYITDMSPDCGLVIALTTPRLQIPVMRDFLERYVSGRVYFGAVMVCLYRTSSADSANCLSLINSPWSFTYHITHCVEAS